MTAARLSAVSLALCAAVSACSSTPATHDTTRATTATPAADTTGYVAQVRDTTSWADGQPDSAVIKLGDWYCKWETVLSASEASKALDQMGVQTADRHRIKTAAHQHLCP